jgi:phosphoglycerate dehydrogenase-like enzyme
MMRAIYLLNAEAFEQIYGAEERQQIASLVEIVAPPQTAASIQADPSPLAQVEAIFSGWGLPVMDEAFLAAAPDLRVVFYGAGSIKRMVTPAFWRRGIQITSAYAANAVPVAEYVLAAIFFSLKRGWHAMRMVRELRGYPTKGNIPGAYGSIVGLVSLGMVGRRVVELLKGFDLHVLAYDPFVSQADAAALGVELCSLDEIFRRAHVVSLHTPWLTETEGMITGAHLNSMKEGATFINTARGAVVRENEMIQVLQNRPDLTAVLDVTYPEPPAPESLLYVLPNVVLTPHIAGAIGAECRRMGQAMIAELRRYLAGEPLLWGIDEGKAARLA